MTALDQYQRLESTGLWREGSDGQRREVVVSVGEASLVITDKADRVLSHWSLPALIRVNPGKRPAIFRPGPDADEEIELDDKHMIEAIEKVRATLERSRAHPGRLRGSAVVLFIAAVVLFLVLWLPSALVSYTVSVVPEAKRYAIGETLLARIEKLTGGECEAPLAAGSLQKIRNRLGLNPHGRIVVMFGGGQPTIGLPGGFYLVNRTLVEDFETSEVLAGFLIAENYRAQQEDPLSRVLKTVGVGATFRLLTTGNLPNTAMDDYSELLLVTQSQAVPTDALTQGFTQASVSAAPYAYALDVTGETTLDMIEANPFAQGGAQPLLSDAEWVSLQGICGE